MKGNNRVKGYSSSGRRRSREEEIGGGRDGSGGFDSKRP